MSVCSPINYAAVIVIETLVATIDSFYVYLGKRDVLSKTAINFYWEKMEQGYVWLDLLWNSY